jgi:hypothetical protein
MFTAEKLNAHLAAGGIVQVTTYLKSTIYDSRHSGWFTENGKGELFVRRGKSRDCLGAVDRPIVSIRLGRFVERVQT